MGAAGYAMVATDRYGVGGAKLTLGCSTEEKKKTKILKKCLFNGGNHIEKLIMLKCNVSV